MVKRKLEPKIEKVIIRKHLVSPLSNFVSPEPDTQSEKALKDPADVIIILMSGIFTEAQNHRSV